MTKQAFRSVAFMMLACAMTLQAPVSARAEQPAAATARQGTDAIYALHHQVIPGILFSENGPRFFNDLFTGNTAPFLGVVESGLSAGYASSLKFATEHHPGFDLVLISFPDPFVEPLCRYAALVRTGNAFRYLALEEGSDIGGSSSKTFLCEWSKEHKHLNHGPRSYTDLGSFRTELPTFLKP